MRCQVLDCVKNDQGFCRDSSYVEITADGKCDSICIDDRGKWELWDGWIGNHDKRIEDATCSKCGYKHPTVRRTYGSKETPQDVINKLPNFCPNCGIEMRKPVIHYSFY